MKLFSNYKLKNHIIQNRVVLPPMVCFNYSNQNGLANDKNVKHYEARAQGGAGIIVVEATCVDKEGRLADTQLGIWCDDHIQGLSKISAVCHKHDTTALLQIHHAGSKTAASVTENPVAPTESDINGRIAREMTIEEIHTIQKKYVDAAIRAEKAGFDGIELHGAHGYLISQFISPVTNKRKDAYGGELTNRFRFVKEIIDEIKSKVNTNFIVGYRMGGNEPRLEDGIEIAKRLEQAGVDLLHVSAGISDGQYPEIPENYPYNWIVYCGTEIRKHISIPVIVVNGIRTPSKAEYLISMNMTDFVAIGKGFLADPNWAIHAQQNHEIQTCLDCKRCAWFSNGEKCPSKMLK